MTWRKKHGDFSRYGNGEVEAAGYTTCDGCPGGNVEYAVGEMKGSGAEVIHPAAGLVVGYPPCPHIACFGDFVGTRYGLEVVYGTHPVPQKYLRMYDGLGTWGDPAWKEIIQPALADEQTRLACDQRTSGTGENGKQVMMREKDASEKWSRGCRLPFDEWAWINRNGIFEEPRLREYVAPFPPMPLMCNVSGLTVEQDFAHHGVDIYAALSEASPKPLTEYENVLDFGCGCGRLARMFKGHPGRITGCDVDPGHVSWINENLDYMKAVRTDVHPPLPFEDGEFDLVIGISVFTHMNEWSQCGFLKELYRISSPEGRLLLTVHGETALERATEEKAIFDMLSVDGELFAKACDRFGRNRHAFILQHGHLTESSPETAREEEPGKAALWKRGWMHLRERYNMRYKAPQGAYEYGITFIPEKYVAKHWSRWFRIEKIRRGAIHNFQDIVVLRPRKKAVR